MKTLLLLLLIFISIPVFSQDDEENECGSNRWDVKTLTDENANDVILTAKSSTIKKQKEFDPQVIGKKTPRLEDEKQVYKIKCYLIGFLTEKDQDRHLIIVSSNNQDTMIAEIVDPTCPDLENSRIYNKLVTVRDKFDTYFAGKKSKSNIRLHIQIEGVGFYDLKHGRNPKGNPPNNREIHPVTKFTILNN